MTVDATQCEVLVRSITLEAEGVLSFRLEPATGPKGGAVLPAWAPGAHIDLRLPDGAVRQYSLCSDPEDLSSYRIAVRREAAGRGGSAWLHDGLRVGAVLSLRGPANHFRLEPAAGYLFVAGGIGITPLLPMVRRAEAEGIPWSLVALGRSSAATPLLGELEPFGGKVRTVFSSSEGRIDPAALVAELPRGHLLYACGPAGLLAALEDAAAAAGRADDYRAEFFEAPEPDADAPPPGSFVIRLAASGLDLEVGADRSVLDVMLEAGIDVVHDCRDGICGSCETKVLSGEIDHRDYVLTTQERQAGDCMMVCVSRAACPVLVLDA